jgi:hypothetical protein
VNPRLNLVASGGIFKGCIGEAPTLDNA